MRKSLPKQLSGFIGRERELAEVKRLLQLPTTRLLTLSGPGGSGKTRLALQVTSELVGAFSDGACWVDLVPLMDGALIPSTIAKSLGLQEVSNRSPDDCLSAYLHEKDLLLVLDNCEHLIMHCAQCTERLLQSCANLKVLTTSREALAIAGELVWSVPSLSLPSTEVLGTSPRAAAESTVTLMQFDAVHLFVERARAALPAFELAEQNATAVLEVCRRLDGLPLAIELAAPRMKMLTAEQIAARLDDRFNLLTAGTRTALPRHQTLRAAIAWSYDLLSEKEQVLFRRLAVFIGGFDLSAAETVCAAQPLAIRSDLSAVQALFSQAELLDVVSHLIDKSLIVVERSGPEARYRMLETIRQYAQERLVDSGEEQDVRARHAHFLLSLAEHAEPKLQGFEQMVCLHRLDEEQANIRTALEWAEEHDTEVGLRLAGALGHFWLMHAHLNEGRQWLERMLAASRGSSDRRARAKGLRTVGILAINQADNITARSCLEESAALCRELDDQAGLRFALLWLGDILNSEGDFTAARANVRESEALFRRTEDEWGLALSLNWLGHVDVAEARHIEAYSLFAESLRLFQTLGDQWGLGLTLQGLGNVDYAQHDDESARNHYEQALSIRRKLGDKHLIANTLTYLGRVMLHQGDFARAAQIMSEALSLRKELGNIDGVAGCLEHIAGLAQAQGQSERAARLFGAGASTHAPGMHQWSSVGEEHTTELAAIRASLGEQAFKVAWASGQTLSLDQAVDYALKSAMSPFAVLSAPIQESVHTAQTPAPELRICALGLARAYRSERELTATEWTYAKARELLFYLLLHPASTREEIGLALWPEASTSQLRNSLHPALHHLRQALGRRDWILFEHGRYGFNRSLPYWFDVEAFEAALTESRRPQVSASQAIRLLSQATALYQGDFLADVDAEWCVLRRAELQRNYLDALLSLGQLRFAADQYGEAADAYRHAIAHDAYLEAAHRELMRCLARLGERAQAQRQYQALTDLLRRELGSPPAPETRLLYERLQRGEEV